MMKSNSNKKVVTEFIKWATILLKVTLIIINNESVHGKLYFTIKAFSKVLHKCLARLHYYGDNKSVRCYLPFPP